MEGTGGYLCPNGRWKLAGGHQIVWACDGGLKCEMRLFSVEMCVAALKELIREVREPCESDQKVPKVFADRWAFGGGDYATGRLTYYW